MKKILCFLLCFCGIVLQVYADAAIEVLDGDSLRINGHDVRLEGIDAPEYNQYCYDSKKKLYACGKKSKDFLRELVKNGVNCVKQKTDRYKRDISICYSGEMNINQRMVAEGWAVAYTRYLKDFAKDEKEAKKYKKGIWQGKFMRPELFRVLERENQKRKN